MIERPTYLEWLARWKDKDVIKILTGMRRSGKSTIMGLFQNDLRDGGTPDTNILSINLESYEEDYPLSPKEFYDYVVARLGTKGTTYVFLDEIQHVHDFPKVVDALYIRKDVDLYITGSNAYFLASDLATLLTGRYVEQQVYTLSFKEYYSGTKNLTLEQGYPTREQLFERYLTYGGLPYAATIVDDRSRDEYLEGVFNTIILKDISVRRPQMNMRLFNATTSFLADNIGNISSINRIATGLSEQNSKVSLGAVGEYVDALLETYLLFKVERFDLKGKAHLKMLEKYYLGDMGFRFWLLGKRTGDIGHRLENVVYLELRRRYSRVDIGKQEDSEIDFVASTPEGLHYFQVAQTVLDEATLERELSPLRRIKDNRPKTLLSLDTIGTGDIEGIRHTNLLDWLLDTSI